MEWLRTFIRTHDTVSMYHKKLKIRECIKKIVVPLALPLPVMWALLLFYY